MAPNGVIIAKRQHNIDRAPNYCPLCDFAIEALDQDRVTICPERDVRNPIVEMLYLCPRQRCNRFFIARYRSEPFPRDRYGGLILFDCVPFAPTSAQIPAEVAKISPDFPKIYDQALAAEAYGLDEITGGGFRKALEFLVKDYCIHLHPEEGEKVRRMPLAQCIAEYVDRSQITTVASRASWLGNDELHYVRRGESHDIETLKDLIRLTINWISDSVRTEKYKNEMQPK